MNKLNLSVKGFLGADSELFDGVKLDIAEKDGFTSVYVRGDAGDKFFTASLAAAINIEEPEFMVRYLSVNRPGEFWCSPSFSTDLKEAPHDTQMLMTENKDGTFTVILPVCGDKYTCVIEGDETGCYAKVLSWYDKLSTVDTLAFVYGTGENPYTLVHDLIKYAAECLGNYIVLREDRPYPEVFEYLGWCTWDAFNIKVSEKNVLRKCQEFNEKNIPVKWAIFDDMWGDVRSFVGKPQNNMAEINTLRMAGALDSFEACPVRFPNGLKVCADKMRMHGVDLAVWHPVQGYWKGISPTGDIARDLADVLVKRDYQGGERLAPGITKENFKKYFDAYHKHMKECGSVFMKVDNQSTLRTWYKGMAPIGEIARNMHEALEETVFKYFDGALINCMCMGQENVWNRQRTAICRCSGDFMPENNAWFSKHVLQCAYNTFYQGGLYWCDWDMWWTDDSNAYKNALIRAISGGPIYVSDTAERSIASVLAPLAFSDGRILRCDKPGVPTKDCLTVNAKESDKALKIFNNCGDIYYVTAFNLNESGKVVTADIDLENMYVKPICDKYIITERFTGARKVVTKDEGIVYTDTIKNIDDLRFYTVAPAIGGFACLGLCEKYLGAKSVKDVTRHGFTLIEKGDCEFYSETPVRKVLVDGKPAVVVKNGDFYTVKITSEAKSAKVAIIY